MYSLKNIKWFKGHDGEPCAQGSLHGLAGKVAEWSDDSWGGPIRAHFVSPAAEDAFVVWASMYLTTLDDFQKKPYQPANMARYLLIETALTEMSHAEVDRIELQKACKKGIVYYRPDPAVGEGKTLYSVKAAYTAENVAALRKKVPDLLEIVNERFAMAYVDGAVAQKAEEDKRFKRLCKSCTIFSLGQADGTAKLMQVKAPYTDARAAELRQRHGNLTEIINERYL
jgi:hypothetical protein